MFSNQKSSVRRLAIREHRPDTSAIWFKELKCNGTFPSIAIAAVFWILATAILLMRQDVSPYRLGQALRYDVWSRTHFFFPDAGLKAARQEEARAHTPHVFKRTLDKIDGDNWQPLETTLLQLPERVAHLSFWQLSHDLADHLDSSGLLALQRPGNEALIKNYIADLRQRHWVILPADQRSSELSAGTIILSPDDTNQDILHTVTAPPDEDFKAQISAIVNRNFRISLQPKILAMTLAAIQPTYTYDADQSTLAANTAADNVPESDWTIEYFENQPIVHKGLIGDREWKVLQAENRAFVATLQGPAAWRPKLGLAGITLLLTICLSAYTAHFQPKVITNHLRAVAICALLISMLLLAQLAGLGTGPMYLLAVAPTLLVGMILSIAYDQRFAVGLASIHALLVTVGLDQRIGFLLIIWIGVVFTCFLLNDVRSRSKLIEVGGVAAIAMMAASAAWGLISLDPWLYVANNCLYVGAAGLCAGFAVLGTLPFIEKAFRITTSMTLLELADASHPLLRRLAIEAPGTNNHSRQVATLSEAAAEAIGANSLLCRVAAYYHDVGKINKPDYFGENQQPGQQNRHTNLMPSVSFLIIKGHVMDGVEMAREYMLPTSLFPFIQQHHGTTIVEYFYHAAKTQQEKRGEDASISETEFRYPGPKPRSREVAILMLADACESATRAMKEPTAASIETLVHKLSMARLLDGQFDECDLTLRDLERIEQSLTKTLLSIYHGRLAYPSTAKLTMSSAEKMQDDQEETDARKTV